MGSEVDVTLAESDRDIAPADVAKLKRSKDTARRKKGDLLQKVLDYRDEHDVGPQPRGPTGRYQSWDAEPEAEPAEPESDPEVEPEPGDESNDG